MPQKQSDPILEKLDSIEKMLKHLLAIQLYTSGATKEIVARHLKMRNSSISELLKGIEKGRKANETIGQKDN